MMNMPLKLRENESTNSKKVSLSVSVFLGRGVDTTVHLVAVPVVVDLAVGVVLMAVVVVAVGELPVGPLSAVLNLLQPYLRTLKVE